ncbi:hypothetical protein FQR65_LT20996 [Abscondita terminalis]|nr:hypothetical protein FQR65_LT20996 [Abscondita terminalis]
MAAVTLLQASENVRSANDKSKRAAIIELFATPDIPRVIPFLDIQGGRALHLPAQERGQGLSAPSALPGINESYDTSTGRDQPASRSRLRIVGGDLDVDKALAEDPGANSANNPNVTGYVTWDKTSSACASCATPTCRSWLTDYDDKTSRSSTQRRPTPPVAPHCGTSIYVVNIATKAWSGPPERHHERRATWAEIRRQARSLRTRVEWLSRWPSERPLPPLRRSGASRRPLSPAKVMAQGASAPLTFPGPLQPHLKQNSPDGYPRSSPVRCAPGASAGRQTAAVTADGRP